MLIPQFLESTRWFALAVCRSAVCLRPSEQV